MVSGLSLDFLVSNVYTVDFSACHAICSTCPQGYMGRFPIHFPHERVSAPYNPVDMRSKSHVILCISRWFFVARRSQWYLSTHLQWPQSHPVSWLWNVLQMPGTHDFRSFPQPHPKKKFKRCKLVDNLDDTYLCYLACLKKDLRRKAHFSSREGPLRL